MLAVARGRRVLVPIASPARNTSPNRTIPDSHGRSVGPVRTERSSPRKRDPPSGSRSRPIPPSAGTSPNRLLRARGGRCLPRGSLSGCRSSAPSFGRSPSASGRASGRAAGLELLAHVGDEDRATVGSNSVPEHRSSSSRAASMGSARRYGRVRRIATRARRSARRSAPRAGSARRRARPDSPCRPSSRGSSEPASRPSRRPATPGGSARRRRCGDG